MDDWRLSPFPGSVAFFLSLVSLPRIQLSRITRTSNIWHPGTTLWRSKVQTLPQDKWVSKKTSKQTWVERRNEWRNGIRTRSSRTPVFASASILQDPGWKYFLNETVFGILYLELNALASKIVNTLEKSVVNSSVINSMPYQYVLFFQFLSSVIRQETCPRLLTSSQERMFDLLARLEKMA